MSDSERARFSMGFGLGWPQGTDTGSHIVAPKGRSPSRRDLALAIGLIKDGRKPFLQLTGDPLDDAPLKYMQQQQMAKTTNFVACHDTAAQLRSLMGRPETVESEGGGGLQARKAAVALAKRYVQQGIPSIIQIKATASEDGHSFSLVVKPDGEVDVLEAWASGSREADLGRLLQQCKKKLSLGTVATALDQIVSTDPDTRTLGYRTLSTAYPDAVYFEFRKDPPRGTNPRDYRDSDANIKLEVVVAELKSLPEIEDDLAARLDTLESFKDDLRLTRFEANLLEANGVDTRDLDVR